MRVKSRFLVMAGLFFVVCSTGALCAELVQAEAVKPAGADEAVKPADDASAVNDAPIMDQRALDILKKMSDTLAAAKTVSFKAYSMVPIRGPKGMWINLFESSNVVKQGADKLYVETRGDFFPYNFYFDGKMIARYAPGKNVYSTKEAPATIDALIEKAAQEEGKTFPYADIIVGKPYDVLTRNLKNAVFVGQSTIQGVKTNHLAFSNSSVEWQIWIGAEDNLPRLVNATFLTDVREPSYTVDFSEWKVNEPVAAEIFTFTNTTNAAQVEFRNPKANASKKEVLS